MKIVLSVLMSLLCSISHAQGFLADSTNYPTCKTFSAKSPQVSAYITVQKGTVVTLVTNFVSSIQCTLGENVFPPLVNIDGRIFAFDLGNGQQIYTKGGGRIELLQVYTNN